MYLVDADRGDSYYYELEANRRIKEATKLR